MLARREVKAPRPSGLGLVCSIPMEFGLTTSTVLFDETGGGFDGTATNSPVAKFPGFEFTAASSMYIDIGSGPTSVKTVLLWIKPDDVAGTDTPIDLNGTDFLTIETGTLTKNGFAGGTTVLYTDGVAAATTVTAAWHHIAITDTNAKNATDFDIARETGNYFDGLIADVLLFNRVLPADEITSIYYSQRQKYGGVANTGDGGGGGDADWLGISSANYDSNCGDSFGFTLQEALGGTDYWRHTEEHTHYFILDLGSTYNVTKVRGRSERTQDPIDVNIYVSNDTGSWGAAVASGITTWQDTASWVEIDTTDKSGRYVKVEIIDTEGSSGIGWGSSSLPWTIFDVYG